MWKANARYMMFLLYTENFPQKIIYLIVEEMLLVFVLLLEMSKTRYFFFNVSDVVHFKYQIEHQLLNNLYA